MKTFRKVVRESGLNEGIRDDRMKVVFHTLRHTYASWMIQEGVPLHIVSRLLGHSSLEMTMRYAHFEPAEEAREAILKIEKMIL